MDFRFNSICFILVCLFIADNQIDARALEKPLREKRNLFDDLFDEEDSEGDNDTPTPSSEGDLRQNIEEETLRGLELNSEEDGSSSPNPYNDDEHDDETDVNDDGYSQSESENANDDVTTQDYEDSSDDQNVPSEEDSDYTNEFEEYKK